MKITFANGKVLYTDTWGMKTGSGEVGLQTEPTVRPEASPTAPVERDIEEKMAAVFESEPEALPDNTCPQCGRKLRNKRGRDAHIRMVHKEGA